MSQQSSNILRNVKKLSAFYDVEKIENSGLPKTICGVLHKISAVVKLFTPCKSMLIWLHNIESHTTSTSARSGCVVK